MSEIKYVIEHLEPELSEWCLIEYRHISSIVGRENLIFTNVKSDEDLEVLSSLGEVHKRSVSELGLDNPCILDPASDRVLETKDKNEFTHLVFGGILGDYPPQGRTGPGLTKRMNCSTRNLGVEQMSTDTAVLVCKKIMDGSRFSDIDFIDEIAIELGPHESVELPFRYVKEGEEVVLAPGLVEYLKECEDF